MDFYNTSDLEQLSQRMMADQMNEPDYPEEDHAWHQDYLYSVDDWPHNQGHPEDDEPKVDPNLMPMLYVLGQHVVLEQGKPQNGTPYVAFLFLILSLWGFPSVQALPQLSHTPSGVFNHHPQGPIFNQSGMNPFMSQANGFQNPTTPFRNLPAPSNDPFYPYTLTSQHSPNEAVLPLPNNDLNEFVTPVSPHQTFFKLKGRTLSDLNFFHILLDYNFTALEEKAQSLCKELPNSVSAQNTTALKRSILSVLKVSCNHLQEDILKAKMIYIEPSRKELNTLDTLETSVTETIGTHDLPKQRQPRFNEPVFDNENPMKIDHQFHMIPANCGGDPCFVPLPRFNISRSKRQRIGSRLEQSEQARLLRFLHKRHCKPFLDLIEAREYLSSAPTKQLNQTLVEKAKECVYVFRTNLTKTLSIFHPDRNSTNKITLSLHPKQWAKKYLQRREQLRKAKALVRRKRIAPIIAAVAGVGMVASVASNIFTLVQLQQLSAKVNANHATTIRLLKEFETKMQATNLRIDGLMAWLQKLAAFTIGAINDVTQSYYASVVFTEVEKDIRAVLGGLIKLSERRLSPDLVDLEQLRNVYQDIITYTGQRGLRLAIDNFAGIFEVEVSYTFFTSGVVRVFVHIPFMGGQGMMDVFQFLPVPIALNNQTLIVPNPREELIAVSTEGDVYRPMRIDTLHSCRTVSDLYYCDLESFLYKRSLSTCIEALYVSDEDQIKEHCEFMALQPGNYVVQVDPQNFVVYHHERENVILSCPNGHQRQDSFASFAKITSPPSCVVNGPNYVLHGSYSLKTDPLSVHFRVRDHSQLFDDKLGYKISFLKEEENQLLLRKQATGVKISDIESEYHRPPSWSWALSLSTILSILLTSCCCSFICFYYCCKGNRARTLWRERQPERPWWRSFAAPWVRPPPRPSPHQNPILRTPLWNHRTTLPTSGSLPTLHSAPLPPPYDEPEGAESLALQEQKRSEGHPRSSEPLEVPSHHRVRQPSPPPQGSPPAEHNPFLHANPRMRVYPNPDPKVTFRNIPL